MLWSDKVRLTSSYLPTRTSRCRSGGIPSSSWILTSTYIYGIGGLDLENHGLSVRILTNTAVDEYGEWNSGYSWVHQENRSPCNEVENSGSPWYTDLNGLPRVFTHFYFIPQGTYFPDALCHA